MSIEHDIQFALGIAADGSVGRETIAAIARKLGCEPTVKAVQAAVGTKVDGIIGPKTLRAVADKLGVRVSADDCGVLGSIPTQAEVRSGRSVFGTVDKAGDSLVKVELPYPLYYDGGERLVRMDSVSCHKLIAGRVQAALRDILEHYGIEEIRRLRLDRYSGCYNKRRTTGGSSWSIHAWGIAFDFDASNNTYSMRKGKASLSRPECEYFWQAWERQGAVSLGRARNYDWMHLQFARL